MNPFTQFLKQWLHDDGFAEFVAYWDELEAIVIAIYRQKRSPAEAAADFERVWEWLRSHFGHWQGELRVAWSQATLAGEPAAADPFQTILRLKTPAEVVGNWACMQQLPVAREAINRILLDRR